MVRSNENGLNVIGRQNAPAVGGKVMAPTEQNRRPLRNINRNIITASSHPSAVQKRPPEPNKDDMLRKNPLLPPNRPITRKFAAQMSIMQQSTSEEVKKEEKSVLFPDEPEDCELLDADVYDKDPDGVNLPFFVQHTEAMRDEIDQMIQSEEVEMEDSTDDLILDIDTPDKNNPLAVVEYVDDMHTYYKKVEVAGCAPPNYMDSQHDINRRMRAILIDWLIEVHYKFDLMDETLYLTVNLIDRFLARQQVGRKKLQLVGVTAMLLASKYEEVSVPVVDDFILITDKAYTREEVLQMEWLMVNTLQFNLSAPTPYMFMRRFLKAAQSNKKLELLSFFMIELCLVEYESLKYPPSVLSAAAIFTAQCTLSGYNQWNITCEWHSGYSQDQLLECARMMVTYHMNAGNGRLTGVRRKYSTSKYGYAAKSEPALFLLETTPPPPGF